MKILFRKNSLRCVRDQTKSLCFRSFCNAPQTDFDSQLINVKSIDNVMIESDIYLIYFLLTCSEFLGLLLAPEMDLDIFEWIFGSYINSK